MRAFLAVRLGSVVRDLYAPAYTGFTTQFRGLRWVRPENLHITLRFLGDTDETKIDSLRREVESVTLPQKRFQATLGGPGCFGSASAPRTLWFGIDAGAMQLSELAKRLEQVARNFGFPPEGKQWSAHVTVARNPRKGRVDSWKGPLAACGLFGLEFAVGHVCLISSKTLSRGPEYSTAWESPLGPASEN
jgi:2'-5' RNA ligase